VAGGENLMNYLPGLASNHDPPISDSQVARIIGIPICHRMWL
jgi:hypothetical protein